MRLNRRASTGWTVPNTMRDRAGEHGTTAALVRRASDTVRAGAPAAAVENMVVSSAGETGLISSFSSS